MAYEDFYNNHYFFDGVRSAFDDTYKAYARKQYSVCCYIAADCEDAVMEQGGKSYDRLINEEYSSRWRPDDWQKICDILAIENMRKD